MTLQETKTKDSSLKWLVWLIALVFVIWLFNAFGFQFINPSLESRAQNGDMFGPANSLFSGLAFAGLFYTILLQRKELKRLSEETQKQEIIRALEKYDDLIKESLLNHDFEIEFKERTYNLYQVMTMLFFSVNYQKVVKSKAEYEQHSKMQNPYQAAMIFEAVGIASLYFCRMTDYIDRYKKISKDTIFVGVYYNKYLALADRLHALGYISSNTYSFWQEPLNKSQDK